MEEFCALADQFYEFAAPEAEVNLAVVIEYMRVIRIDKLQCLVNISIQNSSTYSWLKISNSAFPRKQRLVRTLAIHRVDVFFNSEAIKRCVWSTS